MWEVAYGVGAVLLLVALVYATTMTRKRRTRVEEKRLEAAVDARYSEKNRPER